MTNARRPFGRRGWFGRQVAPRAFRTAATWTAPAAVLVMLAVFGLIDWRANPQIVVGAFGALIALFAFVFNAQRARDQSREQHTIKILFDTRLSAEFRGMLEARRRVFREGQRIDPLTFESYLAIDPDAGEAETRKRHAAEAVRSLLNYYEFLALGVSRRDLDETMLRETVRGIMCNLVIDCLGVIDAQRARNPLALRHLTALYLRWKLPGDPDPERPPA
jgi:hypothetical protein